MTDIFQEVDEEVRRDKAAEFWKKYQNLILAGAVLIGAMFVFYAWRVLNDRTKVRARGVLLASVIYLPILYGLMVFDRAGL